MALNIGRGKINMLDFENDEQFIPLFSKHDVPKISDAMAKYGTLHSNIQSLKRGMRFCGYVVTLQCSPGDIEAIEQAIRGVKRGQVLFVAAGGCEEIATVGASVIPLAKERGLSGFIVDGVIRDKLAWIESGIPVFCKGCHARLSLVQEKYEIGGPISCGGLVVHPGDLAVGDEDGIVVIPGHDLSRVLALTEEHLQKENWMQEKFDAGVSMTELFGCEPKIEKWRG